MRAAIAIVAIGLIHRAIVFWLHREPLRETFSANADWLTWQYVTLEAMREHPWLSLFTLQQTPPLPQLVVTLTDASPYALIALNTALTIAAAVLLERLLRPAVGKLALPIALVFLLSADALLMEYYQAGQTIYESLAMVLVLDAVALTLRARESGSPRTAALLGLCVGALALTRASYSYFFLIPALFLIPRKKALAAYAIPIVLTQFAWNLAAHGTLRVATSSWQGMNLVNGLVRHVEPEELRASILTHPQDHPEWFSRLVREKGIVLWHTKWKDPYEHLLPEEMRTRDQRLQERLSGTNRIENSVAIAEISSEHTDAWLRYVAGHPRALAGKFVNAYALFWAPIRTVSALFYAPLLVEREPGDGINVHPCRDEFVMRGKQAEPTCFGTLPYVPAGMHLVNLGFVHVLVPIVLVWRRGKGASPLLWLLAAVYAYAAFVMNVSEHGENARFRWSVEPVIWLLSAHAAAAFFGITRRLALPRASGES